MKYLQEGNKEFGCKNKNQELSSIHDLAWIVKYQSLENKNDLEDWNLSQNQMSRQRCSITCIIQRHFLTGPIIFSLSLQDAVFMGLLVCQRSRKCPLEAYSTWKIFIEQLAHLWFYVSRNLTRALICFNWYRLWVLAKLFLDTTKLSLARQIDILRRDFQST